MLLGALAARNRTNALISLFPKLSTPQAFCHLYARVITISPGKLDSIWSSKFLCRMPLLSSRANAHISNPPPPTLPAGLSVCVSCRYNGDVHYMKARGEILSVACRTEQKETEGQVSPSYQIYKFLMLSSDGLVRLEFRNGCITASITASIIANVRNISKT